MNNDNKVLFELLKAAIHTTQFYVPQGCVLDWPSLYPQLNENKLLGIVYNTAKNLPANLQPPKDLMRTWQQQIFQSTYKQKVANKETVELLKQAYDKKVEVIAFKGLALSQLYPYPETRFMYDADLLVDSANLSGINEIFESRKYTFLKEYSKTNVLIYIKNKLMVELHLKLWEDYHTKQTQALDKLDIARSSTCIAVDFEGSQIITLGHMQHLIFQMYHMVKHLAYKGIELIHFSDITLFVNKYIDKIDKKEFWAAMDKVGYSTFAEVFFRCCVKYLNMNDAILNDKVKGDYYDIEDMLSELLQVGIVHKADQTAQMASSVVYNEFYSKTKTNKFWFAFNKIFISYKNLPEKYCYAKKYPILLPVVWISQIVKHLKNIKASKKLLNNSVSLSERRLSLMDKFDLLN